MPRRRGGDVQRLDQWTRREGRQRNRSGRGDRTLGRMCGSVEPGERKANRGGRRRARDESPG